MEDVRKKIIKAREERQGPCTEVCLNFLLLRIPLPQFRPQSEELLKTPPTTVPAHPTPTSLYYESLVKPPTYFPFQDIK